MYDQPLSADCRSTLAAAEASALSVVAVSVHGTGTALGRPHRLLHLQFAALYLDALHDAMHSPHPEHVFRQRLVQSCSVIARHCTPDLLP